MVGLAIHAVLPVTLGFSTESHILGNLSLLSNPGQTVILTYGEPATLIGLHSKTHWPQFITSPWNSHSWPCVLGLPSSRVPDHFPVGSTNRMCATNTRRTLKHTCHWACSLRFCSFPCEVHMVVSLLLQGKWKTHTCRHGPSLHQQPSPLRITWICKNVDIWTRINVSPEFSDDLLSNIVEAISNW